MTSSASVTPLAAATVPGWRIACDTIFRWVALLGSVLSILQVAFAALGFWGAEEKPGDQAWGMAAFEPHVINGMILYGIAAVLFVLGLLSMSGWPRWVVPLVLFVLLFWVQGLLVGLGFSESRWYGFLHAISGLVIIGGFGWLFGDRTRHPLGRAESYRHAEPLRSESEPR